MDSMETMLLTRPSRWLPVELLFLSVILVASPSSGQESDDESATGTAGTQDTGEERPADEQGTDDFLDMTLEELMSIKITTASFEEETPRKAPSNVIIVTRQMIERRGYQTLVDVCQDLPGFDFLNYNDGGGEYTSFSMVRGIGGNGNPNILIMVDGIPQNFVNFNWSTLWRFENLLHDLDRIEIIQGPGSALYGAQAFSGVVNFITDKNFEGASAEIDYGWQHNETDIKLMVGHDFDIFNVRLALRKYNTDGDNGFGRPDPGGYFSDNIAPVILTQQYDESGAYHTDYPNPNPNAGKSIPDGFNNWNDSISVRGALGVKDLEVGGFFWDTNYGSSSYISGIEYYTRHQDHRAHMRGYHVYLKHSADLYESTDATAIVNKLTLDSTLVYRSTAELPDSGVRYTYRFDGMTKQWSTYAAQGYLEERLRMDFLEKHNMILGARFMISRKVPYVNTLDAGGQNTPFSTSTDFSWDIAAAGEGLYQTKDYGKSDVYEFASYLQFNDEWLDWLSSSAGVRVDWSSEYGVIANPRAAIIADPHPAIGVKLLYGSAFRQPSTWELRSLEYGNPDVKPEKIHTIELELNSMPHKTVNIRLNGFLSYLTDLIELVDDPNPLPGTVTGQKYANVGEFWIGGLSAFIDYYAFQGSGMLGTLSLHANYSLTKGNDGRPFSDSWRDIDRVATHKANFSLNWTLFKGYLNANFRVNFVGRRKAPETNTWLQEYENGYAPFYVKGNLVLTVQRLLDDRLELQFIANNLWNTQYYGVARGAGGNMKRDYDPVTNPNPSGFIPAYHPQQGRTFLIGAKVRY